MLPVKRYYTRTISTITRKLKESKDLSQFILQINQTNKWNGIRLHDRRISQHNTSSVLPQWFGSVFGTWIFIFNISISIEFAVRYRHAHTHTSAHTETLLNNENNDEWVHNNKLLQLWWWYIPHWIHAHGYDAMIWHSNTRLYSIVLFCFLSCTYRIAMCLCPTIIPLFLSVPFW